MGLSQLDDPVKLELELNSYLPPAERGPFSLRMILHGRRVCDAKSPNCFECVLEDICPSSAYRGVRAERHENSCNNHAVWHLAHVSDSVYSDLTNQVPATWFAGDAGIRRLALQSDGPVHRGRRRVCAQCFRPVSGDQLQRPAQQPLGVAQALFGLADRRPKILAPGRDSPADRLRRAAADIALRVRR